MAKEKQATIEDLQFDDKNFNRHTEFGLSLVEKSLRNNGAGRSILIDKNNRIIGGNGVVEVAGQIGMNKVRIVESDGSEIIAVKRTDIDLDSKQGREMALADNATASADLSWDVQALQKAVDEFEIDTDSWGVQLQALQSEISDTEHEIEKHGKLTDKFVAPPFSVLNTRMGYWMRRKEMWRNKINDNGESREGTLSNAPLMASINSGVSILDPVLAEVVCKWFGIEGGKAFDCFAGDSVFGYVAATLGMDFTGIELREEQAQLNNKRAKGLNARYICDDGQNVKKHIKVASQDLIFSCPPYFNLEVYSDKENDASNQPTYEAFLTIIENAFAGAIECLKENRFACIVVGDVRDKMGFYYNFVSDVKAIFQRHGMRLYNELILVEPIGTLPQRVAQYMKGRKIGKCHQNVLVFYKGNPNTIKKHYKELNFSEQDIEFFEEEDL